MCSLEKSQRTSKLSSFHAPSQSAGREIVFDDVCVCGTVCVMLCVYVFQDCPKYDKIVKHPMDLTTVRNNIESGLIATPELLHEYLG